MHHHIRCFLLAMLAGLSARVWLLDYAELTASERNKVRTNDIKPLCRGGFVDVPDRQRLGIELDPDVVKSHRVRGGTLWQ